MTFGNLALRTKIILSGCLPLALVVALSVIATLSVNSLLKSIHWVDHTHTVIGEAMKIESAAVDMETGMRGYLLAGKEEFLDPYKKGDKTFHDLLAKLKRTVDDNPSQVKLLNEIVQTIDGWKENIVEPMIALRKKVGNGKTMDDIAKLVGEARGKAYFDNFREQIKTFKEREEKLMGLREAEAMNTAGNTKNILLFGTVLTILAAAALSWVMGRAIVKPLSGIIYGLSDGSDQMAASAGQLASSSQQMSMGASDQAASIEETSSSLEEMASMTKQNADNAKQADNLMAETNKTVGHANKSMGDLTVSMEEISKASEETSKIIKTIDEIAFQTNLLALNAAVEAARAGDAGAGFAVVADEVRNLAMRAADAAKNTANLIEGTVKKVSDGTELVTVTNEAFKEVADNSGKVGALVGEISAASVEQAQGIEQINKAIAQMDQVVQKNSATAEENASSSEEMSSQAEQMKTYVNELNAMVGGGDNVSAANRPVAALPPARKGVPADATLPQNMRTTAVKTREVTPEQVIPLDGDDFTNF